MWIGVAASAVLVVALSAALWPKGSPVVAESKDGGLHRIIDGEAQAVHPGQAILMNQTIRSVGGTSSTLQLKDGSRVEMRTKSELALESVADGVRIRLNGGSVIIETAKQVPGRHLYVQTKDVMASVVGAVFFVNAEDEGSRVAVLGGEVQVRQGNNEKTLWSGEQISTAETMSSAFLPEEISWSSKAREHVSLLPPHQAVLPKTEPVTQPRPPEFEVASIRPGPPGGTSSRADYERESVRLENVPLKRIIEYAFDLKDYQVLGKQALMANRYTITARAPAGTPDHQLLPLLQPLLRERFKMVARPETRETPVYVLVVGSKGLKIRELTPGEASMGAGSGQPGNPTGIRTWTFIGSMSSLASSLSRRIPDRPVLDRTGIPGRYSFSLQYVSDDGLLQGVSGPSLTAALEEEIGLKLESRRLPVEFLIIDHIEEPSEN
jgi:uncharacterized protein (TIGR03435 family)